ncbi:probable G-protein coupled receptor 160 [Eucyclogobius newberryi]|uniref:probable G-protein coupled receptor 160 n=1 Tax=Eucyclogobius newberryi TaxID=166745 RepID=UPI003B592A79
MDMTVPLPSMLLGLAAKSVLNWALVFLQKQHICRSFVCVFSLSVSIVDLVLTLFVTFVHLLQDVSLLDVRFTRYHVCLLVQILGFVHSAQHPGVLVLTVLEHLLTVSRLRDAMRRATWVFHLCLTLTVWLCATLYVFKLSDAVLFLDDAANIQEDHCWISSSSAISETATFVGFLLLCFVSWHSLKYTTQLAKKPHRNCLMTIKTEIHMRFIFICNVLRIFWKTWALFLLFLFFHVVLPVEMPSYLSLNCAWCCFLNSLLIALALCAVNPSLELAQGTAAVPPDSFCEWKLTQQQT